MFSELDGVGVLGEPRSFRNGGTSRARQMLLPDQIAISTERHAAAVCLEEASGRTCTYAELGRKIDEFAGVLSRLGVRSGDRVGVCASKSIEVVAVLLGVWRAGAAYVPVDAEAPASRVGAILDDCGVSVVVVDRAFAAAVHEICQTFERVPVVLVLEPDGAGWTLLDEPAAFSMLPAGVLERAEATPPGASDIAYVLYTSGSTGKPKGVVLTHAAALAFVDWSLRTFRPQASDRFSSHAPFHFDLSVFDLFVALVSGACVVLIGAAVGRDPRALAPEISEKRISVWYSAPSILGLLAQHGKLERYDYSALRLVLFAGEVFPINRLRELTRLLPRARYFNLYGPTETNVCTYHEVALPIPDGRTAPCPIGALCEGLEFRLVDADGRELQPGAEGELCISGPPVMLGYWNRPELTASAFLPGDDRFYRTGDIVRQDPDGTFVFLGRRDRMVKRRGHRVELGDIESCLCRHARIDEAAVVALRDSEGSVVLRAVVSTRGAQRPSGIELRAYCAGHLPAAMIPDSFQFCAALPKTSTGKVDYQGLQELAGRTA